MITIWKTPIVATVEQVLKDLKLQLYGAGLLKEIKNTGSDLMCTCPFHANGKEHNPSCGVLLQQKVTKDKTYEAGTVHCYTCGYTADLPQFVADLLGLSSPVEGFKWLVNQYNYQTEERELPDLDMYRGSTAKSSVLEESLVKQYTQNLLQSEEACRYLHKRRIANWVLEAYELGFDPEDQTVLFPVRGMDGKVIFYKGRSIAGKHFYNAKEVDKTSVVFGLWEILNGSFSWGTSDQIEEVWITESEIDALSLISYGVPAVAIMGSHISEDQCKELERTPFRRFVLATDNDDAGRKGASQIKRLLMVDLVTAVSNASSVKVNVDPTAGATVAQIVNLQEQIDDVKSFVGYESSDVYGVEVDFVNKKFTRLAGAENLTSGADFDKLAPWGGRKRCNLTNEGVMVAYRGETGYSEAGATSATITKGTTEYPSGTKVQTMVEQPLFYTKVVPVKSSVSSSGRGKKYDKARFYISPTPKAGFKPVDGFLDDNGILQDKIYLSAFEGSIFDTSAGTYLKADEQVADFATDMLSSIAGAKPASGLTQNLTRANVRKLCTNRGKGWKSHNIFALTATQWLILVEYASMNAQSVIGQGVSTFTDDGSTNMAVVTGATSGLGNGSGIDPNAGVDGKCSVSYRGEENLWGNIWTWLDAINIYNDKASGVYNAFVKPYGECKDDTTADGYKALDFNIATGEGYISGFGYDEDHPDLFLCAEHNGASNLPVGDYYWNNNDGFRVAGLGGKWNYGAGCGACCLSLDTASSNRYRTIGGRLLYVPQTKISA